MNNEIIDIETYFSIEPVLQILDSIDEKLDKYFNEMNKYIDGNNCEKNKDLYNE